MTHTHTIISSTWFTDNWLSLYGAVVGTIALFFSLSKLVHSVGRDRVQLKVSIAEHPNRLKNLQRMKESLKDDEWERIHYAQVYEVTVRNKGTVDGYIENIQCSCSDQQKRSASVTTAISSILQPINQGKPILIKAKSSLKSIIYMKNDEDFIAGKVEVTDSSGRLWKS